MSEVLEFDTVYDDQVVKEIHDRRRQILANYGNDIEAYMASVAHRRIPGVKYVNVMDDRSEGLTNQYHGCLAEVEGRLPLCA